MSVSNPGGLTFGKIPKKDPTTLQLMKAGMIDSKGKPTDQMTLACKILKIDIKDLEGKKEA